MFSKIPADIFNSCIIPLTYNPQSRVVLSDICDYVSSNLILQNYHQEVVNMYLIMYVHNTHDENGTLINKLWNRHFMVNLQNNQNKMTNYAHMNMHESMLDFKFLFGLMNTEERKQLTDYVVTGEQIVHDVLEVNDEFNEDFDDDMWNDDDEFDDNHDD